MISSVQLLVVSNIPVYTTTVSSRSDTAGNLSVAFVVRNVLSKLLTVDTNSPSLASSPLNSTEEIVQIRIFNRLSGLSTSQLILMISPGSACVPPPPSVLQYCPLNQGRIQEE